MKIKIKSEKARNRKRKWIPSFTEEWEKLSGRKVSKCRKHTTSYVCLKCDFSSGYLNSLEDHIKRIHEKALAFSCNKCKYMAKTPAELHNHTRAKHEGIRDHLCQICGYASAFKSVLKNHMGAWHYTIRKCVWCPFSTTDLKEMKLHKEEKCRKSIQSFFCSKCNFSSGYSQSLETHVKRIHEKTLAFSCSKCKYMAGTPSELELHTKAKHEGIREHICQTCGYASSYRHALKGHIKRKHNSIRSCKLCPFLTMESKEMDKHLITVHHDMMHACLICDFSTRYLCSLRVHMVRVHNSVHCPKCERVPTTKTELKQHVRDLHEDILVDKAHELLEETNDIYGNVNKEGLYKKLNLSRRESLKGFHGLKAFEDDKEVLTIERDPLIISKENLMLKNTEDTLLSCPVVKCRLTVLSPELLVSHLNKAHKLS